MPPGRRELAAGAPCPRAHALLCVCRRAPNPPTPHPPTHHQACEEHAAAAREAQQRTRLVEGELEAKARQGAELLADNLSLKASARVQGLSFQAGRVPQPTGHSVCVGVD